MTALAGRAARGLRTWAQSPSAGGVVLAAAALAALALSNSPWGAAYEAFVHLRGEVRLGDLHLSKSLLHWVNDLWMAVFFFAVGLEIKRELLEGDLSTRAKAILPAAAALGGMVVPALIYTAFNRGDPVGLRGWAIPTATDIAFALGVLALLASRIPPSLKVFLTAVAIIDDLGAIVVIAAFYTDELSLPMLAAAGAGAVALLALNRARVMAIAPYVVVGFIVWACVLKSGVHATLAGVITALAIPIGTAQGRSPLRTAEHGLAPWVTFGVLPLFAFVNAGVSLEGASWATLRQGVPLGIIAGLCVGKATGVFAASWLLVRSGVAQVPEGASWRQFFGVCVLCGIGFTMSLFIGALAFEDGDAAREMQLKLGVLCGSLLSAAFGAALLLPLARKA